MLKILQNICLGLLSLPIVFFLPPPAEAMDMIPECIELPGEHDAVTYLLVDRSDELKDTQNLQQSLIVVKKMLTAGERLIVGISGAQATETRVIIDITRPKESLWVSKLKLRASEKKFDDCFNRMQETLLKQGEKHKTSALLETLNVVSKALASDSSSKKRVVMFSDMMQNSPTISFYKTAPADTAALLKKLENEHLLAAFSKVDFHIAGAGSGSNDAMARSVEEFWKQYFQKAGGNLKFYGPLLFIS